MNRIINENNVKYNRILKRYCLIPIIFTLLFLYPISNNKIMFVENGVLASISATIAGFLITAISIIISMNSDFMILFKKSTLYSDIRITFLITIMVFIILTMFFSISILGKVSKILFILGISETAVLTSYIFEISYENLKDNEQ